MCSVQTLCKHVDYFLDSTTDEQCDVIQFFVRVVQKLKLQHLPHPLYSLGFAALLLPFWPVKEHYTNCDFQDIVTQL